MTGIRTPLEPSSSRAEIEEVIENYFQILESNTVVKGGTFVYIYTIKKTKDTKKAFKQLLPEIKQKNCRGILRETEEKDAFKIIVLPVKPEEAGAIEDIEIQKREEQTQIKKLEVSGEKEEGNPHKWTILSLVLTLGTIGYAGYLFSSGFEKVFPKTSLGLIPNIILYVISLFSIIATHEFGHMLASRVHGIKASYPIFIPGLPQIGGSFGAFIRQGSPPVNRDELFDLGLAGPLCGFAVALIVTIGGIMLSQPIEEPPADTGYLPTPLLFRFFVMLFKDFSSGQTLMLHPVAFAGWVGFLITGLNLMPVSQLDGGHVAMAMFKGKIHRYISYIVIGIMLLLGFYLMAFLLFLFMRGEHPPPLDNVSSLSLERKIIGVVSWGIIVLTVPPLSLMGQGIF